MESRLVGAKGEDVGEDGWGVWDQQLPAMIHRMDEQKGPAVEYREYIQYSRIDDNGKEYKKECMMYI